MSADRTRRELLSRGALVGGLAFAGCGWGSLLEAEGARAGAPRAGVAAAAPSESHALRAVLTAESLAASAYERVLQADVLADASRRVAQGLLAHERAHLAVLSAWVRKLPGPPPASSSSSLDERGTDQALAAHDIPANLVSPRTEHDALALLVAVEELTERAYYAAISKLGDPARLRVALAMMACDAQHATVLSELLYPGDVSRAVPGAFVGAAQ